MSLPRYFPLLSSWLVCSTLWTLSDGLLQPHAAPSGRNEVLLTCAVLGDRAANNRFFACTPLTPLSAVQSQSFLSTTLSTILASSKRGLYTSAMTGTIIFTGANSSLGIPATEHLLASYPQYTAILTVRDASESDRNTAELRRIVARFPDASATILALDLSNLSAVHAFSDQISAEISSNTLPPLHAIIANAYHWNLIDDPEITLDGFDKTFQVAHIAHSALILRLLGSFGGEGRVVLLSSDSHWPGQNSMETYPPVISDNLDELIMPFCDADKKGRGYQRYATAKLAITTWLYPLNKYLQKVCRLNLAFANYVTLCRIERFPRSLPSPSIQAILLTHVR